VNKVIVVNEDNIISGNTVLQPEYVPYEEKDWEKEELKRRAKNKKLKQKRLKGKIKIIRNITLAFAVGVTLVGRYCIIYNMQRQLNSVNTNINELNKDNESLKVDLVRYSNIQYIEDTAINNLHMLPPDKGAAVHKDLDKEIIKTADKKSEEQMSKNLWNKVTKMLF
jgi:cell division protein FtsL